MYVCILLSSYPLEISYDGFFLGFYSLFHFVPTFSILFFTKRARRPNTLKDIVSLDEITEDIVFKRVQEKITHAKSYFLRNPSKTVSE